MPISIDDFWNLAKASGLYSYSTCEDLQAGFADLKGAANQATARTLAEWLIAEGALSRYQASVLLSGRPGPFVFGDFVIVERIESGRLSRTFRATFKNTRRVLMVFEFAGPEERLAARSIAADFSAVQAIKSPHVLRVHQFFGSATPPFYVLDDLQGQTLAESLPTARPTWQEACRIGFQAALGLVAMHSQNVVHGGVCPDNLWIEPSTNVKLLQFPLCGPGSPNEQPRSAAVDYLAPELADPNRAPDPLTDIYGLGCTLFELISGRVPFPGGSVEQKLCRHRSEVAQRLDREVPGVSEELADMVAEMLDKEPMLRAQTASHVAHLLSPFAAGADSARQGRPPSTEVQLLAPGYGAWREPGWQAPPKQIAAAPPKAVVLPQQKPIERAAQPATGQPTRAPKAKKSEPVEAEPSTSEPPTLELPSAEPHTPEPPTTFVDLPAFEPEVSPSAGASLGKPKRANSTLIGASVGLVLIALIIIAGFFMSDGDSANAPAPPTSAVPGAVDQPTAPAEEPVDSARDETASEPVVGAAAEPAGGKSSGLANSEIDDDGQTLWTSPTDGKPADARYLPAAAQVLVTLRPAEILAHPEGDKILDALGPAGDFIKRHLQTTLGVPLADVEQLSIAFAADESGQPQAAYVMLLVRPATEEALVEAWGKPKKKGSPKPFYENARLAYHLPDDGGGRVVVIAPPAAMAEILARDGDPTLRAGIEKLWRASDATRHFNLIAVPGYLLTDGESLLVGNLARLREPLARFFDEGLQAVLASAHLGEELFLELRALGSVDKKPQQLATLLHTRLANGSEQLEDYVGSLTPQTYGKLVIDRFPRMVQLASDFTRVGAEDRQAVMRCYLPLSAAHNLVLGTELTLSERPGVAAAAPAPAAGSSAGAALDKKISLSFPRDTLEHSMELLSKEIDTEIVILGPDLQLEGITKNQSFALDERDRRAGDTLLAILQLANPDGKLIYVIKPGDSGREAIFITTRAAAAKRGDPLPAEFEQKKPLKSP